MLILEVHDRTSRFVHYLLYFFELEVVAPGEHTKNSNDVSRVRANPINGATLLVIMSSLYMHQVVKSMVNWNKYNDNIMTSGVAQLKNSRSSLDSAM